jgi:hypothetical protein
MCNAGASGSQSTRAAGRRSAACRPWTKVAVSELLSVAWRPLMAGGESIRHRCLAMTAHPDSANARTTPSRSVARTAWTYNPEPG